MKTIQHVFLVTNGPSVTQKDGDGKEHCISPQARCILTDELFKLLCQDGELVKFFFMPGWLYLNAHDAQGRLEVQPQLAEPIPILVKILNCCSERDGGNPQGTALLAEVESVTKYQGSLPQGEENNSQILRPHDVIHISYHLVHNTGGLSILRRNSDVTIGGQRITELEDAAPAVDLEDVAPVVNSLSGLQRVYLGEPSPRQYGGARDHGPSVYKIIGTSEHFPITCATLLPTPSAV